MKILRCGRAWFVVLALGLSFSSIAQTPADGQVAYDKGDYPTALRIWRGLADQGSTTAQVRLGLMYARGHGVPNDDAEAVRWYRKAAEQGYAWGETNLGYMYSVGRGVAKDDVTAIGWYRKAAEKDFAMAQDNLGVMYRDGRGVPQDLVVAVDWFRKAATNGSADGQNNLGYMYANGRGVARDDAEAVRWYRKAADQGNARAKTNLGQMYADGRGAAENVSQAPPAVDGAVAAKTYVVVSMIGDRLSFVTRKIAIGTRLDHYDRRTEALPNDTVATEVLQTMAHAVVDVAPIAKPEMLKMMLPALQGNSGAASDELLSIARQVLRDKAVGRSWDFIVLLGPRLERYEAHLMGPNLEGLGFYVDPGKSRGFNPRPMPGDVVKGDRFISPFVSSQVWR